jgi:uncharacterized protein YfaS (alpha-2-macroglobulin family)
MVKIVYRVKLTAKGKFIIPSATVEDLYVIENRGQSASSEFIVK